MTPVISIILSTYNQPDWLEKALWGYASQQDRDFEIVIADDGSGPATRERIQQMQSRTGLRIQHVWHPDRGFQKCAILNRAIVAARGNYLIFSDGDCVPRADFVAVHRSLAQRGRFLSGGYTKLSESLSHALTREDVVTGRAFEPQWLAAGGLSSPPWAKHVARGWFARWLDFLTTTKPSWNGHNASAWKDDLVRVNGFDERMQYGGEDRELGERLIHLGLRPRQIRHRAVVLHLEHQRDYVTAEAWARNRVIWRETRRRRATWTDFGIVRPREEAAPAATVAANPSPTAAG
jgi:glycosyltransferase involved in cell wall biosynthesis